MLFSQHLLQMPAKFLPRPRQEQIISSELGADLGGGGGGRPPSGIRPPADPKGPPFDTFSEIHFWRTDPKIFLKAPLAPIYTNFEGEREPKKTQIFCQNFSKSAQKASLTGAENFAKIGAKQCFGRARKINLVDLKKKKKVVKILENFSKIRPPLDKILDPPLIRDL